MRVRACTGFHFVCLSRLFSAFVSGLACLRAPAVSGVFLGSMTGA